MLKDEFKQLLSLRMALDHNDDAGIERNWKLEIDLLKKDIQQAIFFDHDCTVYEFDWCAEIFEGLVKSTQSKEIVESLFRFILCHPECMDMSSVHEHCLYAEGAIDDEIWECPFKAEIEALFSKGLCKKSMKGCEKDSSLSNPIDFGHFFPSFLTAKHQFILLGLDYCLKVKFVQV